MKTELVNEVLKFAEDNGLDLRVTREMVRLDRVLNLDAKNASPVTKLFAGCRKNHWPDDVALPVLTKYWGGDYAVLDGDRMVSAAGAAGFMWVPALTVLVATYTAIVDEFKMSRFGFVAFLSEISKVGANESLISVKAA
jgi:hypothetical protein